MSTHPDHTQIIAHHRDFTRALIDVADALNTALAAVSKDNARLRFALIEISLRGDETSAHIAREVLAEQEPPKVEA